MKFVEKKCPNCGAGLKFDDGDSNVVCEYCNKTYYIQRDEKKFAKVDSAHLGDAYKFVDEYGKPIVKAVAIAQIVMMVVPIVFFVIIAIFIGSVAFKAFDHDEVNVDFNGSSISQEKEKEFQEQRKKIVTKLSQIDKVSLQTFHDTSKTDLRNYVGSCVHEPGDYKISTGWQSIGVYLLVGKETNKNILYDVMSHTYKHKKTGKTITLYAAVKFDNLKLTENGIVNNDYMGWPEVPSYEMPSDSFNGAYGYESVEQLYNQLIRSQSGDYIISATKDLYMES